MPVYYDSKAIIPAPFVSVSKEFHTTDDGKIIGSGFVFQVRGKVVANMGSPNSSGVFWTLGGYPPDETLQASEFLRAIIRKQEGLRSLFSNEGKSFEVQPLDGAAPMKCNPRIRKIEFQDGNWTTTCEYIITLEADIVYVNGQALGEDNGDIINYKVSKAAEEWNMESADDKGRTWRLSHNVSATGKRFYDDSGALVQEAWQNARDYVLNKIGLGLKSDRMISAGVLVGGNSSAGDTDFQVGQNMNAYNYLRAQHVSELSGSFSVTETWLCFNVEGGPAAIEEFNVNVRTAENRITNVTIDGTITGLEVRNNTTHALTSTRHTNAEAKWSAVGSSLLSRAQTISGFNLNPTPIQSSRGINQVNGVITYNYEFNNRRLPQTTNAVTELVTVNEHGQADVFAKVPVLGRALGPVLQDIETKTEKKRTIQIEIQMPASTVDGNVTQPDTTTIVSGLAPSGTQVFVDQDEVSWSDRTGRYTRTVAFTWE